MAVRLYYGSGSPFAGRVWLALEHKGIPYHLKTLSFDTGALKSPEFRALNPRQRVPVLVDDDFALAESAAIVEYIDRWPSRPSLFARDPRSRAIQRRIVREADQYLGDLSERLIYGEISNETLDDLRREFTRWEDAAVGDFLTGELSTVDFTVYPFVALLLRLARRKANIAKHKISGPPLAAWIDRMEAIPFVQKTWPPHWKQVAPA